MRLFFAVPVSEAVRSAAASIIGELSRCGADYKWVEPADFHLTLRFLGERPEGELPALERRLEEAARGRPAFAVSITGLGAFESLERPRVIWLGVGSGASELESLAAALGPAEEGRPFSAHLTLGRLRGPRGLPVLKERLRSLRPPEGLSQTADKVALYESRLSREGPRYAVRAERRLGRPVC